MDKQSLYSALKQVIDAMGVEVMKNPQLPNILNDFRAYDVHSKESNAEKAAIAELIHSNYGEQLLLWKDSQVEERDVSRFLDGIASKSNLQRKTLEKVAKLMQAALGLTEFDPLEEIVSLEEAYNLIETEYNDKIHRLLIQCNDCLGLKNAYYPPEAVTQLYRLEGQIFILARALNVTVKVVGEKRRVVACITHSDSPDHQRNVAQDVLLSEYPPYQKSLNDDLLKPKGIFNKEGAKYAQSTIDSLQSSAERLNRAHVILNDGKLVDYEKDMATKIEGFRKQRLRSRICAYVGIAIVAVAVLLLGIDKIRCHQNRDAIMAFKSAIASGDNMAAHNMYEQSLEFYQKAAVEYTCGYRTHHYQGIARDKAKAVSSDVATFYKTQFIKYIDNDDYYRAAQTLKSIPSGIVLPRREMREFTSDTIEYHKKLAISVAHNRDKLLAQISAQNGKCTDADREEIDRMLECLPEDYSLQIIQKKMK